MEEENMQRFREEYEARLEEGEEGMDQSQAYNFLCDMKQNPTGLDFLDFKREEGKSDDDLFTLEDLIKLNKALGDPEKKLRKAFKTFDHDKDGYVSKDELQEMLAATDVYDSGIHCDEGWEEYWQQTLDFGDVNGDGKLSIDELVKLLMDGGVTM